MRPYGHKWRTVIRPAVLGRAGHRCERCRAAGRLDVAHLDGDNTHDVVENLAALCRKDHRAHDLTAWRRKCHETRSARKDAARPLLGM